MTSGVDADVLPVAVLPVKFAVVADVTVAPAVLLMVSIVVSIVLITTINVVTYLTVNINMYIDIHLVCRLYVIAERRLMLVSIVYWL